MFIPQSCILNGKLRYTIFLYPHSGSNRGLPCYKHGSLANWVMRANLIVLYSVRDSNPWLRRERAMTLTTCRTEHYFNKLMSSLEDSNLWRPHYKWGILTNWIKRAFLWYWRDSNPQPWRYKLRTLTIELQYRIKRKALESNQIPEGTHYLAGKPSRRRGLLSVFNSSPDGSWTRSVRRDRATS